MNKTQRKNIVEGILTKEECETIRTVDELSEWFDKKAKELSENSGERDKIVEASDIGKKFFEEIRPLKNFLQIDYFKDVEKCQPVIGNQSYDAKVWLKDSNEPIHIEIGFCVNKREENALLKTVRENGITPAVGIQITGTKNTGHNVTFDKNANINTFLNDVFAEIKCVALKKSKNTNYPGNVHIVLVFHDMWFFDDEDEDLNDSDIQEFQDFYGETISPLNCEAKKFFLLARSGKFLFHSSGYLRQNEARA